MRRQNGSPTVAVPVSVTWPVLITEKTWLLVWLMTSEP